VLVRHDLSSAVLRFESLSGQPCEISWRTVLSGSKSPWMTVSLTWSACGSMSKDTFERCSAAAFAMVSSLRSAIDAIFGMNVWN
jgi:hypothetical protein